MEDKLGREKKPTGEIQVVEGVGTEAEGRREPT